MDCSSLLSNPLSPLVLADFLTNSISRNNCLTRKRYSGIYFFMKLAELVQFSIHSGVGGVGKIYGAFAFIGCFLLLWFVRYSMNKKWNGGIRVMFGQSLLFGVVVVSWFGLKEAPQYIEKERGKVESFLEPAPEWRADALGKAWNDLSEDGGQAGLTSPDEGGVNISIRNLAESEKYTGFIAEAVEREIQAIADNGLLVDLTDKEDVVAAVFDTNQVLAMEYPRTEKQGNVLEKLVLEHRLSEYVKDYNSLVADSVPRVMPILLIVAFVPLVISIIFVAKQAWDDLMSFA